MRHRIALLGLLLLMGLDPIPSNTPSTLPVVHLQGRIVDDQTGEPITSFAEEWGIEQGGKITWGYGLTTGAGGKSNTFDGRKGIAAGTRLMLRIVANGYLPQPVLPEPVAAPYASEPVVVRLKRGAVIRGTVVDQSGKPVVAAGVYALGLLPLEIRNGTAPQPNNTRTTTDEKERFTMSGIDRAERPRLLVVPKGGPMAVAVAPGADGEYRIRLPEPATLVITRDAPDGEASSPLRVELNTWEQPEWNGVNVVYHVTLPNPGRVELSMLPAGDYDFLREATLRAGDMRRQVFVDRRTVHLEAGQTQLVDLVRKGGHRITGSIAGMKPGDVPGSFIIVRPGGLGGAAEQVDRLSYQTLDATSCSADSPTFQTAPLPPGTYTLTADATQPTDPAARFGGAFYPTYVGSVNVTIPADRPPEPVVIELRPRASQPTSAPTR